MNALVSQVKEMNVPCEIIIIDDGSLESYQSLNAKSITDQNYIALSNNIGRSKIRNLFLKHAKYEYMLFLDCDSLIINESFLQNYNQAIKENPRDVVFYGGRIYESERPERNKLLRWIYGVKKESQQLAIRELHPNKSFMTNNFLIKKSIFENHQFDERIATYGHEDTLFGFELLKNKINIKHINNPILNGHLETNEEFLEKTEIGVKNLGKILNYVNYNSQFIESISLLKFYEKLKSKNLLPFIQLLSFLFGRLNKKLLSKGYVNLKLFDFYKLDVLIKHQKKQSI